MKTFLVSSLLLAALAVSSPAQKITSLTCEHLTDPLGINIVRPRLSWKIVSKERGVVQGAYQILVASSPELLAKDSGDVWDSGKVAGDATVLVDYAGRQLASRAEYCWKVRSWIGGAPTKWSEPAKWSMGLLEAVDWKARWIGSPTTNMVEAAPMLRKEFSVEKKIRRATVYVCGLGYHELSLNGKKVGDHELDPKNTRFDKRALYVTHDVTKQVSRGANAIGVMLGNGWLNYHNKNAWDFDTAPWRAKPELLLQLEVDFADGTTQIIASDATWKYATGPIVFDAMLAGETYDARLEKNGWDKPGYDDSKWVAAKLVDGPAGVLAAQMIPPVRVIQTIKPVKMTQPKPGVFLFDFGQNIAGTFQIKAKGPAGTDIKIETAELLTKDGTLNPSNINTFSKSYPFQTDHYILKGRGTETWRPRFMYGGFQYAQITGYPGTPSKDSIVALVEHTDLPAAGSFKCSNDLLNGIQHATWWSYVNNFIAHPVDCPNRERNGWTGDAHLACETGLYNFDGAANYTQWMRDFRDEQKPGGELPGIIPTGGWGYKWGNGPAWDSAAILIPWAVYQFCGDRRILADQYPLMTRYVDYLTTRARNGIVDIGLGDWCPAKTKTPVNVTSTGYYAKDAQIVAQVARILGRNDDAQKYDGLFETIKSSFNHEFYKAAKATYSSNEQCAVSCALYQGLVEPANVAGVVSNLVENIDEHQNHLDCGILGTKYLLHALTDNGRADVAYSVATQTTAPSWGSWIRDGATTLWEGWDGSGTHNHIMFGDISAWFYETLAGIQPGSPGFKTIVIKPEPLGHLKNVEAWHESPYGRIASSWKRDANSFRLDVEIPANTTAKIYVPARDANSVTEGGRAIAGSKTVKFVAMENDRAIFEVGSGKYAFEAQ